MDTLEKTVITVGSTINAPIEKVWKNWTTPKNIVNWNYASDDWQSPKAENDLHAGGKFNYRMEAKDGSQGFDFWGIYDSVILNKYIEYTMGDSRKVKITFTETNGKTIIVESFEAENENNIDLQCNGWQAILDNFKKYTETNQ